MNSDICFFDQSEQSLGSMLMNVAFDVKTWKSLNRISATYAKKNQPIPISKLTKGILLALVAQGGIPSGARYIQR